MLLLDDVPDIIDQELEWFYDDYMAYGPDEFSAEEIELIELYKDTVEESNCERNRREALIMLTDRYYDLPDDLAWFNWLEDEQLDQIKQDNCAKYRRDDCYGCLYYDPEDQVCRFDK